MKDNNNDNNNNKPMKEIVNDFFANEKDAECRRKFKNLLISRVVLANTSAEVNGAKFLLENIFNWKNDGALETTSQFETIKVEFVSNTEENKNNKEAENEIQDKSN